jgi:hypothetical protein
MERAEVKWCSVTVNVQDFIMSDKESEEVQVAMTFTHISIKEVGFISIYQIIQHLRSA